jgi:hypothetical protein
MPDLPMAKGKSDICRLAHSQSCVHNTLSLITVFPNTEFAQQINSTCQFSMWARYELTWKLILDRGAQTIRKHQQSVRDERELLLLWNASFVGIPIQPGSPYLVVELLLPMAKG